MSVLAFNKKANFEYHIIDKYVAGLSLSSPLVKLLRAKTINLQGVYITYQTPLKSLQLINLDGSMINSNSSLLLNQKEVQEIIKSLQIKGNTCIPLKIFTQKRWIKAEIAVVKGKKLWDKRETIKKRDLDREERKAKI